MARARFTNTPSLFEMHLRRKSKSDIIEVVWDLMMQSPWFDETTAGENVPAVCDKVDEIIKGYKAQREDG